MRTGRSTPQAVRTPQQGPSLPTSYVPGSYLVQSAVQHNALPSKAVTPHGVSVWTTPAELLQYTSPSFAAAPPKKLESPQRPARLSATYVSGKPAAGDVHTANSQHQQLLYAPAPATSTVPMATTRAVNSNTAPCAVSTSAASRSSAPGVDREVSPGEAFTTATSLGFAPAVLSTPAMNSNTAHTEGSRCATNRNSAPAPASLPTMPALVIAGDSFARATADTAPAVNLKQPLLTNKAQPPKGNEEEGPVDLERGRSIDSLTTATTSAWQERAGPWIQPALLILAGVLVWIWPARWFAVLLILVGLALTPVFAPLLLGPLPLKGYIAKLLRPDSELMVAVREWLVEFIGSVCTTVVEKKDLWKPKLDQALAPDSDVVIEVKRHVVALVSDVGSEVIRSKHIWKPKIHEALSPDSELMREVEQLLLGFTAKLCQDVLARKDEWIPTLIGFGEEVIGDISNEVIRTKPIWKPKMHATLQPNSEIMLEVERVFLGFVGKLCQDVLSQRTHWMPTLISTIGDIIPPALAEAMTRHHAWSPHLLAFLREIVPQAVGNVLSSPQLPPAVATFIYNAGPQMAPAVVRLIEIILEDPRLLGAIKKITDTSMKDQEMLGCIKEVIQDSLKDDTLYRAAGHGVKKALDHGKDRLLEKINLR